jgi:hypothetical protein
MNSLVELGLSKCMQIYSIDENYISKEWGPGKDFLIGEKAAAILIIENGETVQVRSLINLGRFSVESTDLQNLKVVGNLNGHQYINLGSSKLANVGINFEKIDNLVVENLKKSLEDILIDWHRSELYNARKMGLKSILI